MDLILGLVAFLLFALIALHLALPAVLMAFSFGSCFIHHKKRAPCKKIRALQWLSISLRELAVVQWVYLLRTTYDLTGLNPKPKVAITTDSVPIILVHGYMDCPLSWHVFKRRLESQLNRPVLALPLRPKMTSIEILADKLEKQLQQLHAAYGVTQFDLIGHSMGGLVACYYAQQSNMQACRSIITLASPFQGTVLSALADGENAKQMRVGADFNQQICDMYQSLSIPKAQLISSVDNVIVPWQNASAHPDGALKEDSLQVHHLGHVAILFSKKVIQKVTAQYQQWAL